MPYKWLDNYCKTKQGADKDFKEEWGVTRYMLKGKMFGMVGHDNEGKDIITLKLEPSHGQLLREEYKDIKPGYYMNKEHWNSIYLDGEVPDDLLKELIDESHALILNGLSKKARFEILNS